MLHNSFNAVVRIRLRMGLDINLDVTEHYTDAIKAAVGVRNGAPLSKKVPKGTTTWTADGRNEAMQFLKKLYELPTIHERIEDIHSKLRKLNDHMSSLNITEDIHHIEPVVLVLRNGFRSNHELSRSGYTRKYNVYN